MNTKATIDTVIQNIKRLRTFHNWNKRELGERAGCDPSYISRLEQGGRGVTLDVLNKIAQAFEIETYELLQHHKIEEYTLREKVAMIEKLDPLKQMMIQQMIDAFLKESKMDG